MHRRYCRDDNGERGAEALGFLLLLKDLGGRLGEEQVPRRVDAR